MIRPSRSTMITAAVAIVGLLAVAGLLSERGGWTTGGGDATGKIRSARKADGRQPRAERSPRIFLGRTPIPLFVNGQEKASLVGPKLQEMLSEVTIVSPHDIRTGWAVADLLQAHGIQQAKAIVFTNKAGERWSADWQQITDSQHRLIVTYSRNGVLLLFSGPEVAQGERPTPRQAKALAKASPDLVSFPNVVKIEVTA